ncbi:TetR/AcrR family transcriptional regulator [Alginatibacterium sediminis]|uniref:TetR/AcrR family transcriptional regulator n=1 Tax=Alginatibacterium sediminis TaxID=2164068 RepID=A0A420E6D3_9ALTE|nr:TetR/AcrR family transcriptional regulator [Alginatibacterium sediminis]RKF13181.1 TetR/AcrR family transcriptional regulator [Alginatibacterium sediminis]
MTSLSPIAIPQSELRTLSQRKREAVVQAALSEFQSKGFQAASMDAISKAAEVSKRTVYNHFESKDALFEEIAGRLFKHSAKATEFDYHATKALAPQLRDFAHKELLMLSNRQHRELVRVMLAESIRSPELSERVMSRIEVMESSLEKWMKSACEDGRLRPVEANYAATMFLGLLKSNAFWPQLLARLDSPNAEQSEVIIEDAVQMFLGYFAT